jgi:hypothetical protein
MVALTRDFHILASGVPTGFTAIFLAIRNIAQARQVSALLRLSIRHHDSVLFRSIFRSLQLSIFDVIPFAQTKPTKSHGIGSSSSVCPRHPDQLHSNRQTSVAAGGVFRGFAPGSKTQRNVRCRRADIASVFGRPRDRIPSYLSEIPVKFVAPTLLGEDLLVRRISDGFPLIGKRRALATRESEVKWEVRYLHLGFSTGAATVNPGTR